MLASRPSQPRPKRPRWDAVAPPEVMPESDPAYPILSGMLGVVPASRWTFARVAPNGGLVSLYGSHANGKGTGMARGRAKAPTLEVSHRTADRRDAGIARRLRERYYARICRRRSRRVRSPILTLGLDALSDRLSALRLQPRQHIAAEPGDFEMGATSAFSDQAFYVLDGDLKIVLAWSSEDQRRMALTGIQTRIGERLPSVLEETVRELTAAWSTESVKRSGLARPVPFLVVRTRPLFGPAGLFTGVRIDRFQPPNSLTGAAAQFHISPREVQVLALLLDGYHLDQIAQQTEHHFLYRSGSYQEHAGQDSES
jgi:hypothetical protein